MVNVQRATMELWFFLYSMEKLAWMNFQKRRHRWIQLTLSRAKLSSIKNQVNKPALNSKRILTAAAVHFVAAVKEHKKLKT